MPLRPTIQVEVFFFKTVGRWVFHDEHGAPMPCVLGNRQDDPATCFLGWHALASFVERPASKITHQKSLKI
jgi:hypothetical protein